MKIKSVSSLTAYVKNLKKTQKFYETLGFDFRTTAVSHITGYSNWFSIDFVAIGKEDKVRYPKAAETAGAGGGLLICLSVDDVDEFHKYLLSSGLKPSGKPKDQPWGNREFVIRDPDGYQLVIFKKK